MASARGVSLIEVLVVMGMLSLILAGGMFLTVRDLAVSGSEGDRDRLMDALLLARGRSLRDDRIHGVRIQDRSYVIFRGESYAARDAAYDFPLPGSHDDLQAEEIRFRDGVPLETFTYRRAQFEVRVREDGRISRETVL